MLGTSTTRGLCAMTSETDFPHRKNADLTFDAICPKCIQTIFNQKPESDLKEGEVAHSCPRISNREISISYSSCGLSTGLRVQRHHLGLRKRGGFKTASHGLTRYLADRIVEVLGQRIHRKCLRIFSWPPCEIAGLLPPKRVRISHSACHRRITQVYV
jgi:hypothetical protein